MIQGKLLWAGILLGINFLTNPSFDTIKLLGILITLDFITGVLKAKYKGEKIMSHGYRKTVVKLSQYVIPVIVIYASGRFIPDYKKELHDASIYLMMFICYIEVTSIFENLYKMDNASNIAKYIYKPALTILKFGMKHNPIVDAAEKVTKKKEENETT